MKEFAALIKILGITTKTNDKLKALSHYFSIAENKDKVWLIALFSGRRPKRAVNTTTLQNWCIELINIDRWLFDECYNTVGDLAETFALLLPENSGTKQDDNSLSFYMEKLIEVIKQEESIKKQFILKSWNEMSREEIFVFNKLLTGSFRIGVSQKIIVNALAKSTRLEPSVISHRLSGHWDPSTITFEELLNASSADDSKPYPFYLAYALEDGPEALGIPEEWQAEWKWDGIRGQIIKRNDKLFVWSRGEELMTDKFPEYGILQNLLPDGIALDGEILPSANGRPLPFALLQTRIGRKNVTKKQLKEAPVSFFAYDLLEFEGRDFRNETLEARRKNLERIVEHVNHPALRLSDAINFHLWEDLKEIRTQSREVGAEGLMLKRKSSTYQVGRKVGDWWKWKIDQLTIDAVMIYAQKGHGRRSNLYTDYTFAVKDGDKLLSFTKAYSGLTDKEFAMVDNYVKKNAVEKFGPVRTVKPELVFEIAFEGIAASNRHKSGVALRFPRISRWRKDKNADEINTLDDLKKMLDVYGKK